MRKASSPNPALPLETWDIQRAIQCFWESNPRTITDLELNKIRTSIREYGFINPPIVNKKTGKMVGGHQRVRAAHLEGLTEIPVILVELDEQGEIALNLALNKIAGSWDYAKLEKVIIEAQEQNVLHLTGFNEADVISILSETPNLEEINNFEAFVERGNSRQSNPLIFFRSDRVSFSCARAEYENYIDRMYSEHGFDDYIISQKFFETIGLE